jgi:Rrf2 family protein
MSSILRISEAASLALHSMAFLASDPETPVPTKEIALRLHISEAHLSKVLQRLTRVGLVRSTRGPKGGFILGKPAKDISLLDVYESIEGPMVPNKCLLGKPVYDKDKCILGGLLEEVDKRVKEYLAKTTLDMLEFAKCVREEKNANSQENSED